MLLCISIRNWLFTYLQGLLKNKDRKLAQTLNSNFRHIDDALSLRNSRLGEYLHHIYPNDRFSSYFDHHILIDNRGRLKTKLYDKRDDFTFPTVIFPFTGNNIPASPAYGIDISQLVHFSRACARYSNFWTKLSCWRKSYSYKATLILSWGHLYKNSMFLITIWLTVTKYSYLKWQWIFDFLRRIFLSSITAKIFPGLDCIYE